MPLEEKMNYLNTCSNESKLNFLLANTCAPVIKNLTCANTLTTKPGSYKRIYLQLKDTDLKVKCLYKDLIREVLIIYRKDALIESLALSSSKNYLKEFDYKCSDLDESLDKLASRFKDFYINNKEFPHELGIFLNYPIEDIKGFVLNNGKNSLYTKYWKVYSNLDKAKKIFKKFDEAIETSLRQVVDGYKLCDIIA